MDRSPRTSDCSDTSARRVAPPPLDAVVFRSPIVTIAAFRCPVWRPEFQDSGPIQNDIFVFPRRSVRIRHEGGSAFVADPSIVTLYNLGQRYSRSAVSPQGDDCEWFAVRWDVLVDAVAAFDPGVRDHPQRPFDHPYAPCPARAYLSQRLLFELIRSRVPVDALRVEESVMALLGDVLRSAYAFWARPARPQRTNRRQREVAEEAKLLLARRLADRIRLADVARALGVSPFHLCRSFKAAAGTTLHAYRNRLRLHHALERVAAGEDLARVGLAAGYSSHSHFTAAFRRMFGVTPSEARTGTARRSGAPGEKAPRRHVRRSHGA